MEHVLLALVQLRDGLAREVLQRMGVEPRRSPPRSARHSSARPAGLRRRPDLHAADCAHARERERRGRPAQGRVRRRGEHVLRSRTSPTATARGSCASSTSPRSASTVRCDRSAAPRASLRPPPRVSTRHSGDTAATSPSWPGAARSTPVIGRDTEIARVMQILNRRTRTTRS
ncbi:MAG: Clp protease N-terminal domain-containing protein [Dehalococcoidia bacterium]